MTIYYESTILLALVKLGYDLDINRYFPTEHKIRNIIKLLKKQVISPEDICKWIYNYLLIKDYLPSHLSDLIDLTIFAKLLRRLSKFKTNKWQDSTYHGLFKKRTMNKLSPGDYFLSDNLWYLLAIEKLQQLYKESNLQFDNLLSQEINLLEDKISTFITHLQKQNY